MRSKIVIIGASGLLGHLLKDFLTKEGYEIISLHHDQIPPLLPEAEVVINLAGANIAGHFWTKAYKKEILESRVQLTEKITRALSPKTRIFIVASAIGYFGNRGSEILTESSSRGQGFLAEVVEKWEKASQKASSCRRVITRIAPVLTPQGGFLRPLKLLFRWGLGARMGTGEQWQSWIHHTDLARAFLHIIQTSSLKETVILASPKPVRQKRFAKKLAKALHRPLWFKIPASLLRLLPGGMGEELFLTSQRCRPQKLIDSGFHFLYPQFSEAIRDLFS